MVMANIHNTRASFHQLRELLAKNSAE